MQAVKTCFRKYATFSGRAPRPEYWWFFLFVILGNLAMAMLDAALFGTTRSVTPSGGIEMQSNGPLAAIFALGTLVPGLAVGWRRMHDSGRSGLFLLYPLIVMVGMGSFVGLLGGLGPAPSSMATGIAGLVLIVAALVLMISPLLVLWWLTRPSQPGPNPYGPNPHEVTP